MNQYLILIYHTVLIILHTIIPKTISFIYLITNFIYRIKLRFKVPKRIYERDVESSLRYYFKKHKRLEVLGKQKRLPLPRGGSKSCQPDIITSTKKGNKLYIIECKKGSRFRHIGHAFGQLHVYDLLIRRIKKNDWLKFIRKIINKKINKKPDLIFGVAFYNESVKDKNSKKIIKEFMKKFVGYRVFLVKNKNDIKQKTNHI